MCLSVSTLTAEPFDEWSQNLVQGLTLINNWQLIPIKIPIIVPTIISATREVQQHFSVFVINIISSCAYYTVACQEGGFSSKPPQMGCSFPETLPCEQASLSKKGGL